MFFEDYISGINHSLLFPESVPTPIYLTLGLAGESGELLQKILHTPVNKKDIVKEAGDVFWYFAMFLHEVGYTLKDIIGTNDFTEMQSRTRVAADEQVEHIAMYFGTHVLLLSEQLKKVARDSDGSVEKRSAEIKSCLYRILTSLTALLNFYKIEIDTVLQHNILKLDIRKVQNTIQGDGDNR